jgi:membrane fusion protein, heavy metal efflux system
MRSFMRARVLILVLAAGAWLAGCNSKKDYAAEAPPPAQVERMQVDNIVQVDHPERYPLFTAAEYDAATRLSVTGTVNPDIARTVPVISLASGRVVGVYARLGDTVKKGQRLLSVRSDDIAGAFSDYQKAVADESLADAQLKRAADLYNHGAVSLNDMQVAQDTENKAKVDVETTREHLRLLGSDPEHPNSVVDVFAPVSGVITDQQVTTASGVQGLSSPNPFTISDLSYVWIVCDVYENELTEVHIGEEAEIRLNALPDKIFRGRISNIGAILDPTIRTAKVRIEVRNPGVMRVGMFVTATFNGHEMEKHALVPASAILHLQDRDWVYVPRGNEGFQRIAITGGDMLPNNMQEVVSGLQPGQKVVANALQMQNEVDNQ